MGTYPCVRMLRPIVIGGFRSRRVVTMDARWLMILMLSMPQGRYIRRLRNVTIIRVIWRWIRTIRRVAVTVKSRVGGNATRNAEHRQVVPTPQLLKRKSVLRLVVNDDFNSLNEDTVLRSTARAVEVTPDNSSSVATKYWLRHFQPAWSLYPINTPGTAVESYFEGIHLRAVGLGTNSIRHPKGRRLPLNWPSPW